MQPETEDNDVGEVMEDLLMKVAEWNLDEKQIQNVPTDTSQNNLSIPDLATSSIAPRKADFQNDSDKKVEVEKVENEDSYVSKDIFLTRVIQFRGRSHRIVMQSRNGPCPLIAAVNALSLLECLSIPVHSADDHEEFITRSELTDLIGGLIIAPRAKLSQGLQLNYEKKVADVLEILPRLGFGLDVNVKFSDITGFEYTKQIDLFDLLDLRLYHSWKVEGEYVDAVGDLFYTQISEKATTDSFLNNFLCSTQSQMTYSGLFALQETVPENSVSVLFRNNHFHTMLRHNNRLYLLATDIGFIGQQAVWETLNNIDGDSEWANDNFEPLMETTTGQYNYERDSCKGMASATTNDHEFAKRLQYEERERLEREKTWRQPQPQDTRSNSYHNSGEPVNKNIPTSNRLMKSATEKCLLM